MPHTALDSWEFWQRSQRALGRLNETMQVMATAVSQDDPALRIPHHVVKDVRRQMERFQANFELLVHAQRKAAS